MGPDVEYLGKEQLEYDILSTEQVDLTFQSWDIIKSLPSPQVYKINSTLVNSFCDLTWILIYTKQYCEYNRS